MEDDLIALLDRYQKHIETCAQCRAHPDAPCRMGQLLADAATGTPAPRSRSKRNRPYTAEEQAKWEQDLDAVLHDKKATRSPVADRSGHKSTDSRGSPVNGS